ncbi:hypothetical protein I7I51_01015 [Histoplasma capsulatum]|uniref:Uncharacterized protein n=1 Tax=Ajellomyces capsulatus TaxID=5037 RepID=A0A8A1MH73_AJECA|nr:predicted protein [Histoplasma mississippiense (nom. inval.)]EDN10903.1 predicted protein [Histoplasma mississippiense (nom. inval.)]QSS63954.1 hypothetical protein I7I51_01015 [Histoplasma capsulatum]
MSTKQTLNPDIVAELETKKTELERFQKQQEQLGSFIFDLQSRREELENLSTSARQARERRLRGTTASIDQEIVQYQQELESTVQRIAIIRASIQLLSPS